MAQYDFNTLYGAADNSFFIYPKGLYDAVVTGASYGMSKDGSKGQWTVEYMITTGPDAGRCKIKDKMTISADNPVALGIMFRQLDALQVPWQQIIAQGGSEEHMAQAMVGKAVQLSLGTHEWDGTSRQDVKDIRPPRPGAPTQVPAWQPPAQQQQAPANGFGQMPGQAFQPAYGSQPSPQQGPYGAQPGQQFPGQAFPQQPGQQPQQPQQPGPNYGPSGFAPPQQPGGPAAYSPVAAQQGGNQPGPIPGAPPWAQPPVPGQGGLAEFTPGGMSQQQFAPQPPASPWGQQPQQGQPQQAPAGYGQPQQAQQQAPSPFGFPGQAPGPEDQQGGPVPPWQQ